MPTITQICTITGQPFEVNEWEQQFLNKMGFPLPTLCIEERHRRRLSFRNERSLSNGTCDFCKKPMVSLYTKDKPYTVYCQPCWWSDSWDALTYGRDFDFSKPFFEQFADLLKRVPRIALLNKQAENAEYCNPCRGNKNCYLVFGGDFNQDSYYSLFPFYCNNVVEVMWCEKSELLYQCVHCNNCINLAYSQNCESCSDSMLLYNCKNLRNCFGCVNLQNKEYHFFNKPLSKEQYLQAVEEMLMDTAAGVQKAKQQFEAFRLSHPHKYAQIINSENCSGDTISNAKNCTNCFDAVGPAEDVKDAIHMGFDLKDAMSFTHAGFKSELLYEVQSVAGSTMVAFCNFAWDCSNALYSDLISNCQNVFGCTNMNRKQFCILNKQYSETDYKSLLPKIVAHMRSTGEWGQFFPMSASPFAYNETSANDLFPLTKEQAETKGLKWKEESHSTTNIPSTTIPDDISDVTDEILSQTLICSESSHPYRIINQELSFHRKQHIPISHVHPEKRFQHLIKQQPERKLYSRACQKCLIPLQSPFSPTRPEIIYCEPCFLATIY